MNIITHQGIVENINGSHIFVRIIQTSACSGCSVKGHCSSAETKEKVIEVTDSSSSHQVGDCVTIVGKTSVGMLAVFLAFVAPLLLLVLTLFLLENTMDNQLLAPLMALAILVPYYWILSLNKTRLKQRLSFTIKPINN